MSKLETYGLSPQDLLNVQWKIAKQKNYLESQKFVADGGKEKSLLDVSFSANLSERYYPRILNKVDTFVSTSLSQGLTPVFLTATADGFFRRMIKGDYSEWTDDLKEKYDRHIPNNDRSGHYMDYMNAHNQLTPKDIYKIMGHQLHGFYMCDTLKNIRKDGLNYTSIRVTEPHKDGVPHFHILMYIPEQYIPSLYKDFTRFFPAPRNHKKLTVKNSRGKYSRNGKFITEQYETINNKKVLVKKYETHGFQTEIRSATGYILKYILKSFKNLIEGKEIDYLQAWYVHNKIPRLITTHTLVSQHIYQKSSMMEDDWHYLTDIKLNGGLTSDSINNYFKFDDGAGRIIMGDNGLYILSNNGRIVSSYGSKQNVIPKYRLRSLTFSANIPNDFNILKIYEIWTPPRDYSFYINKKYDDGTIFSFGNQDDFFISAGITFNEDDYILDTHKPITQLTDMELYSQYNNFDFDMYVPARYALIHNEMIDRDMLRSEKNTLNHFTPVYYGEANSEVTRRDMPTKIRDMNDDELQSEFNNANFLDDETRYALLSYEMNKRDLL